MIEWKNFNKAETKLEDKDYLIFLDGHFIVHVTHEAIYRTFAYPGDHGMNYYQYSDRISHYAEINWPLK